LVAAGQHRVQRLHDERAARLEKRGRRHDQFVDGVLADQREVRDRDVDREIEGAAGDVLVRRDAKLTRAGGACLIDERGDGVDPTTRFTPRRSARA
jgi:hypothetical protein